MVTRTLPRPQLELLCNPHCFTWKKKKKKKKKKLRWQAGTQQVPNQEQGGKRLNVAHFPNHNDPRNTITRQRQKQQSQQTQQSQNAEDAIKNQQQPSAQQPWIDKITRIVEGTLVQPFDIFLYQSKMNNINLKQKNINKIFYVTGNRGNPDGAG